MTTLQPLTGKTASRLSWWWRGLAWLCSLLTLVCSGPFTHFQPTVPCHTAGVDPLESEERAPVEEEDESKDQTEKSKEATRDPGDRKGSRRSPDRGLTVAWRAHLSGLRVITAGHVIPLSTPFERGARLPLRC